MSHSKSFFKRHPAVLPGLLGLAIVIVGTLTLVFIFGSRDAPPPADGDLALERLEIPDEANAYKDFVAAAAAYVSPMSDGHRIIGDFLHNKSVDTNVLNAFVVANHESLALLHTAARRTHFLVPDIQNLQDLDEDGLKYARIRWLARLILVKGSLALEKGDYSGANETCTVLIRLGGLVQEFPDSLVQYFVGTAILEKGLTFGVKLAQDSDAPTEVLRSVGQAMARVPSMTNGFIWASKAEYRWCSLLIDSVANGTVPPDMQFNPYDPWEAPSEGFLRIGGSSLPRYFIQPNRTKRRYAEHIRRFVESAPRPYADRTPSPSPMPSRFDQVLRYIKPNTFGYIMLDCMNTSLDDQLGTLCVSRSDLAAARLVVALHLHRREHGAFPERLDALVPGYLEEVPLDPFDGKPFRYDPKRRIVYSVGKNLVDDGGSALLLNGNASDPEPRRRWNAEDAVYRIEPVSGK